MIDKLVVFPRVVIYKNLLNNVDSILNMVKKSETYNEKTYLFSPWNSWNGNWSGLATQIDGSRHAIIDSDDEPAKMQKLFFKNVFEAFDIASKDFLNEYAGHGEWPKYITNWDLSNDKVWNEAGISILKYDHPTEEQTKMDLAMNYHTDTNHEDMDSPGHKLTITVTMYLNDDYEGGEISFYDDTTKSVYNYKPRAGDITVFPSFAPYYHGVLPFDGPSRYLLRMFVTYYNPGSEEWFANLNKYGESEWLKIEKERLSRGHQNGSNLIHISYDESEPNHSRFRTYLASGQPVWIK